MSEAEVDEASPAPTEVLSAEPSFGSVGAGAQEPENLWDESTPGVKTNEADLRLPEDAADASVVHHRAGGVDESEVISPPSRLRLNVSRASSSSGDHQAGHASAASTRSPEHDAPGRSMFYQCIVPGCQEYLQGEEDFTAHMEKSHPVCFLCQEYATDSVLLVHLEEKHLQCTHCQEWVADRTGLESHIREHHPEFMDGYCPFCCKLLEDGSSLEAHIKNEHKCPFCDSEEVLDLDEHISQMHPEAALCPRCGVDIHPWTCRAWEEHLVCRIPSHPGPRPLDRCPVPGCGKRFHRMSNEEIEAHGDTHRESPRQLRRQPNPPCYHDGPPVHLKKRPRRQLQTREARTRAPVPVIGTENPGAARHSDPSQSTQSVETSPARGRCNESPSPDSSEETEVLSAEDESRHRTLGKASLKKAVPCGGCMRLSCLFSEKLARRHLYQQDGKFFWESMKWGHKPQAEGSRDVHAIDEKCEVEVLISKTNPPMLDDNGQPSCACGGQKDQSGQCLCILSLKSHLEKQTSGTYTPQGGNNCTHLPEYFENPGTCCSGDVPLDDPRPLLRGERCVLAARDLRRGEIVHVYQGQIMTEEEFKEMKGVSSSATFHRSCDSYVSEFVAYSQTLENDNDCNRLVLHAYRLGNETSLTNDPCIITSKADVDKWNDRYLECGHLSQKDSGVEVIPHSHPKHHYGNVVLQEFLIFGWPYFFMVACVDISHGEELLYFYGAAYWRSYFGT